jgi:hypothetical protein
LRVGVLVRDVLFDDDEWSDEPEEFDPEHRWGRPERDLPSVPVAPKPETAETDVDPELFKTFWASVIFANLALFGLSLGAMLIGFRGNWTVGLVLVAVGTFALVRTWAYYVSFRDRDGDEDDDRAGA